MSSGAGKGHNKTDRQQVRREEMWSREGDRREGEKSGGRQKERERERRAVEDVD